MSLQTWFAFVAAAAILLAIPGPTVTLVVGYALGVGKRAAWATVAGVALGDFAAMTLSLAGLGAVLAASAMLFAVLKWIGAAYLVYLGIRLWRAEPTLDEGGAASVKPAGAILWHAFAVTALNPKSILFFVAFVPQFIDAGAPVLPQLVVFEVTFVAMAALNAALYAALAGRARRLVRGPAVLKAINRVGGGILVGAGIAAVAWRRAS
ncbi:MAG: LysE family translocator [Alphaproteobacteria bacterium]|nr:LysE family translocator [Alphaproteobacteria bacterium]